MPAVLSAAQLAHDLAVPDLTDRLPAMRMLIQEAVDALHAAWVGPVRIVRGEPIVPIADNYDNLGYAADAVTRDERYSRYVDAERMLRSHSTALIPGALRALAADPADVLLAVPAMAYRRDSIDRIHTGTPHQLDLWRISRAPLGPADLTAMIDLVLTALTPGRRRHEVPKSHPYTMDGRELNVEAGDGWVEVGECGVAHPGVLARAGLSGWSGLAMGLGLDRLLMLRKAVPDIRLLRSADPRIAGQWADLEPYRPVSNLPAIVRDISVAVADDAVVEEIGDQVRDALGEDAELLEEVRIVSATPYRELPERARERLGITEGQQNLLIRLVIRPPVVTLTDARANELRDRVYRAVHRGGRAA